ncbi:MAG: M20 family metallopeptidase [Clostridia bacterium]|nr:M20 family metallopeptidase [Clostridia bacterium]
MKITDYKNYLIKTRRYFHSIPEIAYNEYKTQAQIVKELKNLGLNFRTVGTAVIAKLDIGKNKTLAFRSDIDALPITEKGEKTYKSKHQGFMHACGHDGHIANLLAFSKYCALNPEKLGCNVVFIFQPAEETEGGAINMIENGALDGVDEIYAIHLDPSLKKGMAGIGSGVSMAGSYVFDITATGESSHCAEKHKGTDALHALIDVITNIYDDIPENIKDDTVFHCGKISGGVARNIVADSAVANCTLRYFEYSQLETVLNLIDCNIKKAEKIYGAKLCINMLCNYIPLENSGRCIEKVKKYIEITPLPRRFTAEDFAFYLKETEGCLIWIGTDNGEGKKLHSADFDFDESVLLSGLKLFISLAEEKN